MKHGAGAVRLTARTLFVGVLVAVVGAGFAPPCAAQAGNADDKPRSLRPLPQPDTAPDEQAAATKAKRDAEYSVPVLFQTTRYSYQRDWRGPTANLNALDLSLSRAFPTSKPLWGTNSFAGVTLAVAVTGETGRWGGRNVDRTGVLFRANAAAWGEAIVVRDTPDSEVRYGFPIRRSHVALLELGFEAGWVGTNAVEPPRAGKRSLNDDLLRLGWNFRWGANFIEVKLSAAIEIGRHTDNQDVGIALGLGAPVSPFAPYIGWRFLHIAGEHLNLFQCGIEAKF
jgi:hypothetical protein